MKQEVFRKSELLAWLLGLPVFMIAKISIFIGTEFTSRNKVRQN